MTEIHSGTTTERIVRTGLMMVLLVVFAGLYLRDGYGGYARKNAQEFARSLGLPLEPLPTANPTLTAESVQQDTAEWLKRGVPMSVAVHRLGLPTVVQEGRSYYLGSTGWFWLEQKGDWVEQWGWMAAPHSGTDIRWQKIIAWVLTVLALGFVAQFIRVVTTRASLTEAGLKVRGRPAIPFDAMRGLRAEQYKKKGWVDLDYELGGRPGSVRLDDYVIREFKPILAEICARRGFDNPAPLPGDGGSPK
ncbi:MAG TPA: hypothetical protein PKK06_16560 [Phycisphaerae bacterium]|nr:hypothetical protein [Phycisphaerae bacterium]HNU45933.1 hypothetical protein [Phycisphaerae bacterium]